MASLLQLRAFIGIVLVPLVVGIMSPIAASSASASVTKGDFEIFEDFPRRSSKGPQLEWAGGKCRIPADSSRVNSAPGISGIWPGQFIRGEDYKSGKLGIDPKKANIFVKKSIRGKLSITFGSALAPEESVTPSETGVQKIINERLEKKVGVPSVRGATMTQTEIKESSSWSAELGFSAGFGLASVNASVKAAATHGRHAVIFAMPFISFSAYVNPEEEEEPAGWFNDKSKKKDLEAIKGKSKYPLVVDAIDYGGLVLVRLESKKSAKEIEAAFSASYGGFSGSAAAAYKEDLNETSISAQQWGGSLPEESIKKSILEGNLNSTVASSFKSWSDLRPVSFGVSQLKNSKPAPLGASKATRDVDCNVRKGTYTLRVDKVRINGIPEPGKDGTGEVAALVLAKVGSGKPTFYVNNFAFPAAAFTVPCDKPMRVRVGGTLSTLRTGEEATLAPTGKSPVFELAADVWQVSSLHRELLNRHHQSCPLGADEPPQYSGQNIGNGATYVVPADSLFGGRDSYSGTWETPGGGIEVKYTVSRRLL